MEKFRKVTSEMKYEVCDLCGEEITASYGNTIMVDIGTDKERDYVVHLMDANKEGCIYKLIVKALKK